jgi:hypothetical protein
VLFIHAVSGDARSFSVSVNGGAPVSIGVHGSDWATPTSVSVNVTLLGGRNSIALYNDAAWAPDLDRIVVW